MDVPSEPVRPDIKDTQELESLLKKNYGLTVESIYPLDGYDDLNYHAKAESSHTNDHIEQICPHGYLVKIVNAFDSKSYDFNLGQKLVMDHLNSHGISCQKEVKKLDGQFFSSITVEKDGGFETYMVSVRTYLPGVILAQVTLTSELAYDVGLFTAKICRALQSFQFSYYDSNSTPLWNMDKFMKVKEVLHVVKEIEKQTVAEEVFQAFESKVIPRREKFRAGMIHGDLNEQNILVQKRNSGVDICGLLDFQDTTISYPIYDLAIIIGYMMMLPNADIPVVDIGGHLLAGYGSVVALNEAERESLRTLVAARIVMSLLYGAYNYSLDPSNEYLLFTSKVGWVNLLQFWRQSEEATWKNWDHVTKSLNKC